MKLWTLCNDSWANDTFLIIDTLLPGAKGSGTIKGYTRPHHMWLKTLKYIFTSVMKLASAGVSWSHSAGSEVAPFAHCGLFRGIFLVVICGRSLQSRVITGLQVARRLLLIREVCQYPARFLPISRRLSSSHIIDFVSFTLASGLNSRSSSGGAFSWCQSGAPVPRILLRSYY